MENENVKKAFFISTAIKKICNLDEPSHIKVLDFGCGMGDLADSLLSFGYDAYGCDIKEYWLKNPRVNAERMRTISSEAYHLPFDDSTFDIVVSTSVLEHAQNKEECFQEIFRILKQGGYSMHLYPGKWYLPYEPHIYVPLMNYFWPKCPRWWLGLWALFGIRNEFQGNKSWREVLHANYQYCRYELSYWSNRRYRQLSLRVFGNVCFAREFYICNSYGGFARIFRRFPFKKFFGWLSGEFRMNFIVQRKIA